MLLSILVVFGEPAYIHTSKRLQLTTVQIEPPKSDPDHDNYGLLFDPEPWDNLKMNNLISCPIVILTGWRSCLLPFTLWKRNVYTLFIQ